MKKRHLLVLFSSIMLIITAVILIITVKRLKEKKDKLINDQEMKILKIYVEETGLTYDIEKDTVYKTDTTIAKEK